MKGLTRFVGIIRVEFGNQARHDSQLYEEYESMEERLRFDKLVQVCEDGSITGKGHCLGNIWMDSWG